MLREEGLVMVVFLFNLDDKARRLRLVVMSGHLQG